MRSRMLGASGSLENTEVKASVSRYWLGRISGDDDGNGGILWKVVFVSS